MVRLVKGAYWDSEIKRAQVDGLDGFPVFTRKVHTDVCYLACARKLLAAPDAVFPQFATHNAQTLASVMALAGPNFYRGQYEFQCLHGMGEPLYEEVVGRDKLDRPCRVYAPVGSHETLLAYLVRRLLENGANTSFVNRIADASVPIDELIADPVAVAARDPAARRAAREDRAPARPLRRERANSRGLDFSDEQRLAKLAEASQASARHIPARLSARRARRTSRRAGHAIRPTRATSSASRRHARAGRDRRARSRRRAAAAPAWAAVPPNERAAILRRAADALEAAQRRARRPHRARGRQVLRQRRRRGARGRRLPALLRGTRRRAPLGPGSPAPLGVVACISPGIFRSRSSPARSPRRSPPAMPCSPSPPRRRR